VAEINTAVESYWYQNTIVGKAIKMLNETKLIQSEKSLVTLFAYAGQATLLLVMLASTTSCGKKSADAKASQTIVRVNGDEITMHQINSELQRANVRPDQLNVAGKQLASALVDRQILIQEAEKAKLDRKPRVIQAIENAKMQIVAQAYIENKMATVVKPTSSEITEYRAKHADIFANRKVFVIDELAFKVEPGMAADVESFSNTAKSTEEVTQWLNARQISFLQTRASHASETIPPELLAKLATLVVGDMVFVNANGTTIAGQVLEIKDAAISEKDSKPLIERIIFDQKRKQIMEDEMKRLRSAANVEYINKKFEPATVMQTPPSQATQASAKPVESTSKDANGVAQSHYIKGLSGLK
jgi:EpsD family peptidyl-prolyl cis-trans isomerase